MIGLDKKFEELRRYIHEKGRNGVVIAFSGGVDSTTLAAICVDVLHERAIAVTAKSPSYPPEEIEDAKKLAKEIGIKHYILETDELLNEFFVRNPENRCYYCKKELLNGLQDFAKRLGVNIIFEGTNFSDLSGHRPGYQAIKEEVNVLSPWAENKFNKREIRTLAEQLGLSIYDKPALACLASRIPFGEQITEERLNRVGKAEKVIKQISKVRQLRVRDHNGVARIEVGKNERKLLYSNAIMDKIAHELKRLGFKFVTMDLEGYRTGSMLDSIPCSK
ncbi:MAG: ATP-dependent sacrificial sulfur transferase LarE [Candidatus Heimdallarchaeota archaeon]